MIDRNDELMDFVALQTERFLTCKVSFDFENAKEPIRMLVRNYIREHFIILVFNLTAFWLNMINLFWNDSKKVFEMLSDFPAEYIEKLAEIWWKYFEQRKVDFKIDFDDILNRHWIKYDFISWLLVYLDNH